MTSNSTGEFFEECAVTAVNPTHVELTVLRGENLSEGTRTSIALGALALPGTKAECDFELAQRADQEEAGHLPARYAAVSSLSTEELDGLETGRVVHWHQDSEQRQLCISPEVLSADQIKVAREQAFGERDIALRRQISDIENTAFYERTKLERILPNEPFYLFDGAEIRQRSDGSDYIYIPPRILISERWGPRRIAVVASIFELGDPENDPLTEEIFTASQHVYRVGARQPYGDVGQSEQDTTTQRIVRIEVLTSAPLGHQKAHEEQKLEIRANGIGYWAELDKEHLWETAYYPDDAYMLAMNLLDPDELDSAMQSTEIGKQNIKYVHFTQVGEAEPNVVDVTDGDEGARLLPSPFMARLVVPFDLDLLREIEAEFPGI